MLPNEKPKAAVGQQKNGYKGMLDIACRTEGIKIQAFSLRCTTNRKLYIHFRRKGRFKRVLLNVDKTRLILRLILSSEKF